MPTYYPHTWPRERAPQSCSRGTANCNCVSSRRGMTAYHRACDAASSIRAATSFGLETYTAWLAPSTSTLWLLARAAYHRSRSGLIVLSFVATSIQLGLLLHAAVVITALKFSA